MSRIHVVLVVLVVLLASSAEFVCNLRIARTYKGLSDVFHLHR